MQSKLKSILPNTLWRQPRYSIETYSGFFLKDEDFVSRKINEDSVDLDMFPASRVCQLAKKMESSKSTARHFEQVVGDPQAAQINFMHHQGAELSNGKYKKKKPEAKQKQAYHKASEQRPPNQYKKSFDLRLAHKDKYRCSKCRDSSHLEGFQCPAKKYQCKACHRFGHYTSLCFQKLGKSNLITNKGNPLHIN